MLFRTKTIQKSPEELRLCSGDIFLIGAVDSPRSGIYELVWQVSIYRDAINSSISEVLCLANCSWEKYCKSKTATPSITYWRKCQKCLADTLVLFEKQRVTISADPIVLYYYVTTRRGLNALAARIARKIDKPRTKIRERYDRDANVVCVKRKKNYKSIACREIHQRARKILANAESKFWFYIEPASSVELEGTMKNIKLYTGYCLTWILRTVALSLSVSPVFSEEARKCWSSSKKRPLKNYLTFDYLEIFHQNVISLFLASG